MDNQEFIDELRRLWKIYDGRNLWVKHKSFVKSGNWRTAKLIHVPDTGTKVEIFPPGHRHTEWHDARIMMWSNTDCRKFHPDWDQHHAETPEEAKAGPFYLTNERGFWSGTANGIRARIEGATEYDSQISADRSLKRISKRVKNLRVVNELEAQQVLEKIPEIERQLEEETSFVNELKELGLSEEVVHTVEQAVQLAENIIPSQPEQVEVAGQVAKPIEPVMYERKEGLDGAYEGLMVAWKLFTEEGTRFLKELGKVMGQNKKR